MLSNIWTRGIVTVLAAGVIGGIAGFAIPAGADLCFELIECEPPAWGPCADRCRADTVLCIWEYEAPSEYLHYKWKLDVPNGDWKNFLFQLQATCQILWACEWDPAMIECEWEDEYKCRRIPNVQPMHTRQGYFNYIASVPCDS